MMCNPTKDGKIPDYIYKQMMECMMKDWQEQGRISLEIFDSWEKAGHPNAKQVNEMIWWM
jgi:hypothetical protein